MPPKETARRLPLLRDADLPPCPPLADEDEVEEVHVVGDLTGVELDLVTVARSTVEGARFTAAHLRRARFVDCSFTDVDLSGAVLEDCRFERVELVRCRLSGVEAQGSRFVDVGLFDCKLDGANLRVTTWERAELRDCILADADLYGATLPGARVQGCDLTGVQLSKADLAGARLHGSRLEGVQGGESLRGVVLGSDQLVPAALAVFGSLGIVVDDDEM